MSCRMKSISFPVIRSASLDLLVLREGLVRLGLGIVLALVGLVANSILRGGGAIFNVSRLRAQFSHESNDGGDLTEW